MLNDHIDTHMADGFDSDRRKEAPAFVITVQCGDIRVFEASPGSSDWFRAGQIGLPMHKGRRGDEHSDVAQRRPRQSPSDDLIHSRIIFRLFTDPLIDDTFIEVRIRRGMVSLDGSVVDFRQRARVQDVIAREAGVVAVCNHLMVLTDGAPKQGRRPGVDGSV